MIRIKSCRIKIKIKIVLSSRRSDNDILMRERNYEGIVDLREFEKKVTYI